MEILIVSKSRGTAGRVRLGGFTLALLSLLMLSGVGVAAYWGYVRGSDDMADLVINSPERTTALWQREIVGQRQFLNQLDSDLKADLSALSGAVGRIQGALSRLDAAADRVVTNNGLAAEEFAFGEPIAVGGPHPPDSQPPTWKALLDNIDALDAEIERRDARLTALESFLRERASRAEVEPDGRPVSEGWISSGYGYRTDPVSGRREFHGGIDFAGQAGIEVKAVAAGVVTWSGKRWGYGNLVELNHGNGYVTRYAHNRANLVRLGEKVEKNQPIALLGSSGRSTGPHVHFEVVRNDRSVNPWKFIRRHAQ